MASSSSAVDISEKQEDISFSQAATPVTNSPAILDPEKHAEYVQAYPSPTTTIDVTTDGDGDGDEEQARDGTTTPEEGPVRQRWNESWLSVFRFFTALNCFFVMGLYDGSIGALIPYIEIHYDINYTIVSLLLLMPFVGYTAASLCANPVHHHTGRKGPAIIGPFCSLAGFITMAFHPPFAVMAVMSIISGFGSGIVDSAWNTWAGNMQNANEMLGFLHGTYGLGATIGPLVATAMVASASLPWYTYYYFLVGMAVVMLVTTAAAWWGVTAAVYRAEVAAAAALATHTHTERVSTRRVLREPTVWLVAVFLLTSVGGEVSISGWVTTFMLKVRGAPAFEAGLTVTFFWLGLTVGRMVLGFVTGRVGPKLAVAAYVVLCVVLVVLYWLVPSYAASAVFITFVGFFNGPMFPGGIYVLTRLLPREYHVPAVGFAAAVGGGGGSLLPFAVGAIAQQKGVQVLPPIAFAIFSFSFVLWLSLPGGLKNGGLEKARENNEKPGKVFRVGWGWLRRKLGKSEA